MVKAVVLGLQNEICRADLSKPPISMTTTKGTLMEFCTIEYSNYIQRIFVSMYLYIINMDMGLDFSFFVRTDEGKRKVAQLIMNEEWNPNPKSY